MARSKKAPFSFSVLAFSRIAWRKTLNFCPIFDVSDAPRQTFRGLQAEARACRIFRSKGGGVEDFQSGRQLAA